MLRAKDFRHMAWEHLGGKWGMFAVAMLLFFVTNAVCGALSVAVVGLVATILVSGPIELGLSIMSLNVARGTEIKIEQLFDGFKNMTSAIILWLLNNIFIALWALLFVIPGIIKFYSYSMSFFVLRDNPTMSQDEARRASMAMMHGNKWRLFCLDFSFIGWILLSMLTLGILLFWVIPYIRTAHAEFYQSLISE